MMQANSKAKDKPVFNIQPALCSFIKDVRLIKISIAIITKGNTNTLKTCVIICALMGFTPKIGTIKPTRQAIPNKVAAISGWYQKKEDICFKEGNTRRVNKQHKE